jgi:hypothetical protein
VLSEIGRVDREGGGDFFAAQLSPLPLMCGHKLSAIALVAMFTSTSNASEGISDLRRANFLKKETVANNLKQL